MKNLAMARLLLRYRESTIRKGGYAAARKDGCFAILVATDTFALMYQKEDKIGRKCFYLIFNQLTGRR